ncbi:MAG: NF038143 family protein [Pseudomonadota bacterium]
MIELAHKKEIILRREMAFADAIGASVLDKPKVSYWMVFIPILFLYFIYRMQGYKSERLKFSEDFMITRRRAMDVALEAAATGGSPDIADVARNAGLSEPLLNPYVTWMKALVDYYLELLASEGGNFESIVRAAYSNRSNFLLTLNRLNTIEKAFYTALKPHMEATEGAADIITKIESQSQELRRKLADHIFC